MSDEWIVLAPRRGIRPETSARVTLAWRMTSRRDDGTIGLTGYVTVSRHVLDQLGWPAKCKVEVAHDVAGTRVRARVAPQGYSAHNSNGCAVFQAWLPWGPAVAHRAEAVQYTAADGVLTITLPEWARKSAPPPEPRRAIPLAEPGRWTPERRAIAAQLYPTSATMGEIVDQLNALPGPAVTKDLLNGYARNVLGLSRPAMSAQEKAAAGAALRKGERRDIGPPLAKDAAPPTARDELEAKVALRKGRDARAVADEFGIGLNIVSRWAAEVREEKGRAA